MKEKAWDIVLGVACISAAILWAVGAVAVFMLLWTRR